MFKDDKVLHSFPSEEIKSDSVNTFICEVPEELRAPGKPRFLVLSPSSLFKNVDSTISMKELLEKIKTDKGKKQDSLLTSDSAVVPTTSNHNNFNNSFHREQRRNSSNMNWYSDGPHQSSRRAGRNRDFRGQAAGFQPQRPFLLEHPEFAHSNRFSGIPINIRHSQVNYSRDIAREDPLYSNQQRSNYSFGSRKPDGPMYDPEKRFGLLDGFHQSDAYEPEQRFRPPVGSRQSEIPYQPTPRIDLPSVSHQSEVPMYEQRFGPSGGSRKPDVYNKPDQRFGGQFDASMYEPEQRFRSARQGVRRPFKPHFDRGHNRRYHRRNTRR